MKHTSGHDDLLPRVHNHRSPADLVRKSDPGRSLDLDFTKQDSLNLTVCDDLKVRPSLDGKVIRIIRRGPLGPIRGQSLPLCADVIPRVHLGIIRYPNVTHRLHEGKCRVVSVITVRDGEWTVGRIRRGVVSRVTAVFFGRRDESGTLRYDQTNSKRGGVPGSPF